MSGKTHESDFYTWTREQAEIARRRDGNALDWDNVAGELDVMGNEVAAGQTSSYRMVLMHLLNGCISRAGGARVA